MKNRLSGMGMGIGMGVVENKRLMLRFIKGDGDAVPVHRGQALARAARALRSCPRRKMILAPAAPLEHINIDADPPLDSRTNRRERRASPYLLRIRIRR